MSTSSAGHDHSSMSSSSSASMGMSMPMVFTDTHTAPLFSSAWTPDTTGKYAGTCIFLIVLALISRLLLAYRHVLELKWHDKAVKRRYVVLAGESDRDGEGQMNGKAGLAEKEEAVLTSRGVDENVRVVRSATRGMQLAPWRFSVDLPRSLVFVVQAGVGYLLMLAVMTLNVGYFLSVLAGLFVGELAVGRYAVLDDGHH
ncbi:Ctr copper transporter [Polychaeton citri CBS 116435]|uniref:Copper transport protein n=1 Tax=Polychaeton citri CBS 116435 TaxID=1314669 RepID=A0A9P4UQW5_9PEZI|nr:Ctr copper transporter [Polychaeton citri CBS 116435]